MDRLSRFFPGAIAIRLPVRLSADAPGREETTVIEYGTPSEVLFASSLPLEFGDRVRLLNTDGSLDAEALVVALRYEDGRKAVAARFARQVANWIIKP